MRRHVSVKLVASLLAFAVVAAAAARGRAEKPSGRGEKAPEHSEKELPAPALFGRVSPSIVVIVASGKETLQGSGVVIGPGRVVTNNHVVAGATRLGVRQGDLPWPATPEAVDPKHDLAILAIDGFDRPRAAVARSCREAARICDRLGFKARAADLRERQTRVQARASGND